MSGGSDASAPYFASRGAKGYQHGRLRGVTPLYSAVRRGLGVLDILREAMRSRGHDERRYVEHQQHGHPDGGRHE